MTGSHTGSQEWQSFEIRMRQRRVERCLLKADVALEAGFAADAREALEEARYLSPFAPELSDLERRVASLESAPVAGLQEQQEAAPTLLEGGAGQTPRAERRWMPVAATALLLLGAGALSIWLRPVELHPLAPEGVASAPFPQALPIASDTAPAPSSALTIATDSITAAEIRPELEPLPVGTSASAEPLQVAASGSADAPAADVAFRSVTPAAIAPPPAPLLPPRVEAPRAELRRDTPPVTPVNALPASSAGSAVPPPDPVREAPSSGAPNPLRSDEPVKAVLARYESAYSTLDAAAATAVYPELDHEKLARAFEGLAAQRVSLGSCAIHLAGAAATADCDGSATWTPKVGGGARTQARRWRFQLRLAGEHWRIVNATVR